MQGIPPKLENDAPKDGSFLRHAKLYITKAQHDAQNVLKTFVAEGHKGKLNILVVPLFIVCVVIALIFIQGAEERNPGTTTRMLRVENPSMSLICDQDENGTVTSAWLRTPKTSRRIGQLEGLTYIADSRFYADVDGDGQKDLLWRISFNNEDEKEGIHLWVGVLSGLSKIYVCSSPYEYTRWDAVPTKIRVPKSCALYVSPSIPGTDFRGKDCYPFIYTIKLTADGPAFVPVASVYKQLFPILRAYAQLEKDTELHKAYIKMLMEFKDLSEGKLPDTETVTNLQINDIDLIPLK